MSRIDDLIARLCPAGVEFKPLGEIGRRNKGTPITAAKMKTLQVDGGPIRIFAGGQTIADVAEDAVPATHVIREPSIIVKSRGHIGFAFYDRPFSHKTEMWSYTIDHPEVEQKFIYYFLLTRTEWFQELARATSVKLPQLGVRDTDGFKVPVPPLEVQRETVRILDQFTQLEAELEAELEARRQQYAHYRNMLLTFSEDDAVPWMSMSEVLRIKNGKDHKALAEGDIPVYGSGGVMRYVDTAAAEGPSVLIPRKGSLGNLFYVEGPFWVVDTIFRTEIDASIVEPKFLFHQLLTMRLGDMNQAGGVPSQTQSALNRLKIRVPSLEVQREIVQILDQFIQLESELEAELEARRKQYEFYRDRLLTFKEAH